MIETSLLNTEITRAFCGVHSVIDFYTQWKDVLQVLKMLDPTFSSLSNYALTTFPKPQ